MDIDTPSRETLLRYLLHQLEEDDRETIDTLLVSDAEYHAAFLEAEYDLRDALAAGELTPEEAARARRALPFLNIPARKSTPHSLPVLIKGAQDPATTHPPRRAYLPVWLAAAAVLLIATALGTKSLLFHKASSVSPTQSELRPPPVDRPMQATEPPVSDGNPAPKPTIPSVLPKPRLTAVLLLPGGSRSTSALSLPIPHDAIVVRIDWPSPEEDAGKPPAYQLQVLNDAGKVFCTTPGIRRHSAEASVVQFLCPVRDVPSGIDFMRIASITSDPDMPFLLEVTVSVKREL